MKEGLLSLTINHIILSLSLGQGDQNAFEQSVFPTGGDSPRAQADLGEIPKPTV